MLRIQIINSEENSRQKFGSSAWIMHLPSEELIRRGVKRGDGPDDDRLRSYSDISPELLLECNSFGANLLPKRELLLNSNKWLRRGKDGDNLISVYQTKRKINNRQFICRSHVGKAINISIFQQTDSSKSRAVRLHMPRIM